MTDNRLARLGDLFEKAADRPRAEWPAFAREACGGDAELERELLDLLERDATDDDRSLEPVIRLEGLSGDRAAADTEALPERIGRYRVLRRLGAGGMGVVYEALQEDPARRVAVKVVRGGSLADDVQVRLFRREVATLARLDHPGIASIIEAGQARDGLPYFAMELVDGERLDDHADRLEGGGATAGETRRARLQLFLALCEAVHYAHQRGVLHRDLKPSNILVLPPTSDDSGSRERLSRIKVLDFGLARLTEQDGDASVLTRGGDVRGTLQYMSPEQAGGSPDEVDVRADVYSLGVILFRLLTGALPYDVSGLPVVEAIRLVCDQPPRSPRRVGGDAAFPRDLEAILAKALEKRPAHRYQSVFALQEDIGRYLERQPVEARAPTTLYQLRLAIARHRGAFTIATAFVLLLAAFAAAMTVAANRTAKARDRANAEAETASLTADFLVDLFNIANPNETAGDTVTTTDILTEGTKRVREELDAAPDVRARLLETLSRIHLNVGRPRDALVLAEEALEVRRVHSPGNELPVGVSWTDLGLALHKLGDYEEAKAALERALTIYESQLPEADAQIGLGYNNLGMAHDALGEFDAAEAAYDRALAIRLAAFGPDHEHVATTRLNRGNLFREAGEFEKARVDFEDAIRIFRARFGEKHPRLLGTLNSYAGVHYALADYDGASEVMKSVLAIQEEVLGGDHPEYAMSLSNLSLLHQRRGDYEAALDCDERAMAIYEERLGAEHELISVSLGNMSACLAELGRVDDARRHATRALAMDTSLFGPEHEAVASSLARLAALERDAGESARADSLFVRSLDVLGRARGSDHPTYATTQTSLAILRDARGYPASAETLFVAARRTIAEKLGPDHPELKRNVDAHAAMLRRLGREAEARRLEESAATESSDSAAH